MHEFDGLEMDTPSADLEALRALTKKAELPGGGYLRVIEVGSWVGRTALNFLEAKITRDIRVFCIDNWQGSPNDVTADLVRKHGVGKAYITFLLNCQKHLFRQITPCVGDSAFWARIWPWEADLVFIDANHDYEAVKNDIELWRPRVRDGGILCGHDYDPYFGVKRAVDELVPDRQLAGLTCWWTRVEQRSARPAHNRQVVGSSPTPGTL